jgi:hypothetical protein
MRLLPCKSKSCSGARLKEGPYALASWSGGRTLRYRCQCGTVNVISQQEWLRLPNASLEELLTRKAIHWGNLDIPKEQRAELESHGFTLEDVCKEARDVGKVVQG